MDGGSQDGCGESRDIHERRAVLSVAERQQLVGHQHQILPGGAGLQAIRCKDVVHDAINGNHLPHDGNGIYFVLTATDVTFEGFCTTACGWHTYFTTIRGKIVYGVIGDATVICPGICIASLYNPAANLSPGVDCAANVIAHELAEAASDPHVNAWLDSFGNENADKCAWKFGYIYNDTNSNGDTVHYNMVGKNGMKFLIQQNWDVVSQSCLLQTTARKGWW